MLVAVVAAAVAAASSADAVRHAAVEPDAVVATFVVELQLGLGLVHDVVQLALDCWPL